MKRRIRGEILLAAAGLAVAVLLGEGLLRLVHPMETVLLRVDSEIGWTLAPNLDGIWRREVSYACGYSTFRTGPTGLRDPLAHRDAGRCVWVAGDSFVQAANVREEDTACAHLERLLSRERPVEVVNLGVQGYGPLQADRLVARFLRSADVPPPDLILHVFFVGNDFVDGYRSFVPRNRLSATWSRDGGLRLHPPEPGSRRKALVLWLGRRSPSSAWSGITACRGRGASSTPCTAGGCSRATSTCAR